MDEEQRKRLGVVFAELIELLGGWKMKRLSLLVALSALLVAGTATAVNAQALTGTIYVQNSGARDIPLGVNEVGRFARFMGDERMLDRYEVQLSNRDYQNWKPLEPRSKEKMLHFMSGNLRVHHPLVPEQSTGLYSRYVVNEPMAYNNLLFENRDFAMMKVNGASSRNSTGHFIRGLAAGSNLVPTRGLVPIQVGVRNPLLWY
jgi:hypothetical protein